MNQPIEQRRLGTRTFILLIVMLCAFAPISTDMYLPALGTMVEELHTDASTLNMTLYGYMMTLAVSMLVMGPVIDKYGRKGFLLADLVLYIASSAACAMVGDVYSLILFRVLQAFASGGVMTIAMAFVKDSFRGPDVAKVLGIQAVIGVLGPVIAPIAGAALIDLSGWRLTLVAPALFALVCLALSLLVTETLPDDERVVGGFGRMMVGMKGIARDRYFMMFLVMICMFNMPFMAYLSVSSYIYVDVFGLTGSEYSLMLAIAMIVGVSAMSLIGRLTRNVVNWRMIPLYLVLGAVGSVLLLTIGDSSWYAFLVSFIFILTASVAVRPWGMGVLMRSHPGDSGAVSSMMNSMFFVWGTIGMVLSTIGWSSYILGLGVLGVVASVVYLALFLAVRGNGASTVTELDGTPTGEDRSR
ncbi:MAG: MFS transporter [archaeon]|nr:MFS transporter [archaeon]